MASKGLLSAPDPLVSEPSVQHLRPRQSWKLRMGGPNRATSLLASSKAATLCTGQPGLTSGCLPITSTKHASTDRPFGKTETRYRPSHDERESIRRNAAYYMPCSPSSQFCLFLPVHVLSKG